MKSILGVSVTSFITVGVIALIWVWAWNELAAGRTVAGWTLGKA